MQLNNSAYILNIIEAIEKSDYIKDNKNLIISTLFDQFSSNDKIEIFLIKRKNDKGEKIIVVRYPLTIRLKNKLYDIYILIYFVADYPNKAPEIYIERSEELGINPKLLNIINPKNFRIITPSLICWDNISNIKTNALSNLKKIIKEIYEIFSNDFPVFRLDPSQRGKFDEYNCVLHKSDLIKIKLEFPKEEIKINNSLPTTNIYKDSSNINMISYKKGVSCPNIQHVHDNNHIQTINRSTTINNSNNKINKILELHDSFLSLAEIRKLVINDISSILIPKIQKNMNILKNDQFTLYYRREYYKKEILKIQKLAEKKDEIIKTIKGLSASVDHQILGIKMYIIEKNKNKIKGISVDNVEDFINVGNPEILRLIALEALIDDLIIVIKRSFLKKILNINECIKNIRNVSREQFKIKCFRNKLIKQ
jgi:hypothetical protein